MNRKYTQEHLDFLKENIVGTNFKNLTEMFNKRFKMNATAPAIASLADRHGLHNKRVTLLNGWEPTQFKKGNKPHNWVPIGSERITKDGYIQIKVQEGKFQKNWKGKHILIWEEHNGPVPKGHNVIFGDGNNRNFGMDNLILVTKAQMLFLNRNKLIKNDADITKIGIALAKVDKKLNERRKNK